MNIGGTRMANINDMQKYIKYKNKYLQLKMTLNKSNQ